MAQVMQQATAGLRKQPNPSRPVLSTQQVHKITYPSQADLEPENTDKSPDLKPK
ncbi:MAG: hypothetical protein R3F37_17640 [Candidatus Competibacteraceae bacterium]